MSSKHNRSRQRQKRGSAIFIKRNLALIITGLGVLVIAITGLLLLTNKRAPGSYQPEYTGGPRIEVSQDMYDYGYVKLDTPVTTEVEIRNVGDKPLTIARLPQVQVLQGC